MPTVEVRVAAANAVLALNEDGTVVANGTLSGSQVTYTITEKQDEDGTTYHTLVLGGTGAMPGSLSTVPWMAYADTLREVTVKDGITSINLLFGNTSGISGLERVDLHDCTTLTTIEGGAFRNCKNLTGIDLSGCTALESIGDEAFYGCSSLQVFDFSSCPALKSIGARAFYGCEALQQVDLSGCTAVISIGSYAFYECSGIQRVNLSGCKTLTSIGDRIFSECSNIEQVNMSGCTSVTSIGDMMFYRCSNLKQINLSGCTDLASISKWAFMECSNIEQIDLSSCTALTSFGLGAPEDLTSLVSVDLSGCTSLTSFVGFEKLMSVDLSDCTALTSIAFSKGVGNLVSVDLSGCTALTSIGKNAFKGLYNLTSVDLSNCTALTSIGTSAFESCGNLTKLDISGCTALTSIGSSAFDSCYNLEGELVFPASLTDIGSMSFYNCRNITVVDFSHCGKLNQVGDNAFTYCDNLMTAVVSPGDEEKVRGMTVALEALGDIVRNVQLKSSEGNFYFSSEFLQTLVNNSWNISFADREARVTFACEEGASKVDGAMPLNGLSGAAFIDAQGAIYLLNEEDTTASLAFLPDEIEDYNVPETISVPDENGQSAQNYAVRGVSSYALLRAHSLESLHFQKADQVTLAMYALAGCPTLRQVNGKTTVAEASTLFADVGDSAFWGSGLLQEEIPNRVNPETSIVLQQEQAKMTLSAVQPSPCREKNNSWITGTGATVLLNVSLDGSDSKNYQYRLYLLASGNYFDYSGLDMEEDRLYTDETTQIQYILRRSADVPGLFYIDIQMPETEDDEQGLTWSRQFRIRYNSGTPGGQVMAWIEMAPRTEQFPVSTNPSVNSTHQYYEFVWETEPVPYTQKLSSYYDTFTYKRPAVGSPVVNLGQELNWRSGTEEADRTVYKDYPSLATDPVREIKFYYDITLPEGLCWSKEIRDALADENANITASATELCVNGIPILTYTKFSNYGAVFGGSAQLDEKGVMHIVLRQEPNKDNEGYIDSDIPLNAIMVENPEAYDYNKRQTITVQSHNEIVYSYNQPPCTTATKTHSWRSVAPADKLNFEKDLTLGVYALSIENPMLEAGRVSKIEDTLPGQMYLDAEDIHDLFTQQDKGQENSNLARYLTVTIKDARVYEYENNGETALGTVTLTDGSTEHILTAAETDEENTPFNTKNVKITYEETDLESVRVQIGEDPVDTVKYADLENYFIRKGISTTSNTRYMVTWDFPESYTVPSGGSFELYIYFTYRQTFQRLIEDNISFYGAKTNDAPTSYHDHYVKVYNTATLYEAGGKTLQSTDDDGYLYPECAIQKSVDATDIISGQVLNYGVTVYQQAYVPSPAGLPVVDVMSGVQVLLAPVSQNKNQPWVTEVNPPIYTDSAGTEYYRLEVPKDKERYVYQGVWLGSYYADSVTVIPYDKLTETEKGKYSHPTYQNLENAIVQDGMVTEIRWYLTSIEPTSYTAGRKLTYKALADADYSRPGAPQANTLNNIVYLNDRDGDRIFYPIGELPVRSFSGAKELLDDGGNPVGNSSTILAGQTVHYRLSVANETAKERSLTSSQLWDILPDTKDVFDWNADTVKVRYAYANTDGQEPFFRWDIDKTDTETHLIWPGGVTIPAHDILYIYVDLTFPAKETGTWDAYCEAVGRNTLVNTFRLLNESFSVTHTLALPTEAYIQKGVRNIMYKSSAAQDKVEYINNHHIFYEGAAGYASIITYYAMIYNQGPGPLYLTELQDLVVSEDGSAVHLTDTPELITDGFTNVPDGATLVQATITGTRESSDKGDLRVFRFAPSQALPGKPTISYDAEKNLYYLEPNQALAFSYLVRVYRNPETVVNTLSMPLHDPHGSGVSLTDDMEPKRSEAANDGDCDQWTANQAADQGFASDYSADHWLWSRVSLQKGNIVPGLEKEITKKRDRDGTESSCDGFAASLDALQWSLTVRNTGDNVLQGYTITDTLPDHYTLAKGTFVSLSTKINPGKNLEITNVERSENKVTAVTFSSGSYSVRVPVNGEETSFGPIMWPECSMALSYNEEGQMVIRATVDRRVILPGEAERITFWTENATNIQNSTTYVNSAVLTLPNQDIDYDEVSIGRVLRDEDGNGIGVQARAAVTITAGFSTASVKSVTEQDAPNNTTDSVKGDAITLTKTETGYSGFTYELQVVNSAANAQSVQWMTLIDNLPEQGDHFTLNQDVERNSEFKVNFQDNPNVKVWYVTSDGQRVDLTEEQFTVQYSTKTTFSSADWGSTVGETITSPAEEGWGAQPTEDSRSIRIALRADSDTGVIPADATVHVSFDCQVAEPQNVAEGQIAWNSFGYRYQMSNSKFHLESAPMDVGVMIPDYPRLEKSFVDENGLQSAAHKDASFRFLVYTGEPLEGSYKTGSELLTALAQDNRTFSLVTMPFTAGQEEQTQKLKDLKVYTYNQNTLTKTEQNWVWTHNETYTVLELGETNANELGSYWDYQFYRLNNVEENQYSFTYSKETSQLIRFQNQQASRQLDLIKVDQSDTSVKLPGAIFALYSAEPSELWTETELQEAYTTLQLTDAQKQAVESHKSVTLEGQTYTLCNLGVSDSNGLISWKELPGKTYCYQELWAPEGYQILVQEPQSVSFEENNNYIRQVTKTVENSRVYSLPKTGGIGRWQIPAAGFILAAFALLLLRKKRRKGNI